MPKRLSQCLLALVFVILFLDWLNAYFAVDLTPKTASQLVVDRHGNPMRAFADEAGIWRYPITLDQVSPNYLAALLAYEDRYFYYHPGVNPWALARSAWQWLSNGEIVSGGSTLTMQVARLRYGQRPGIAGKLQQMIRALQLEWRYSKADILTYYINHAPFGGALEGVEAASRSYFGHASARLTDAQAALLAGLPQAPSYYRPDRHPERARYQRDKVLARWQQHGDLALGAVAAAKLEPVQARVPTPPLLSPLLARQLQQTDDRSVIPTTIDRQIQQPLAALTQRYSQQLPSGASLAAVVMRHGDGDVLGYVGSADFADPSRFGYIDMTSAVRSPGSTLKPFIYGMALDQGIIHSASLLIDAPLVFDDYLPRNFDRGFSGPVAADVALNQSLNLPAVQVLDQLGAQRFYSQLANAGVVLPLPKQAKPNLAIGLGGSGTTLLDLMALYSAFGNAGEVLTPRLQPQQSQTSRPLLSPASAWIIRDMLAEHGQLIKTGTSAAYQDSWTMLVNEFYTIGVWVGMPDNQAMTGFYGGVAAKPLAIAISQQLPPQPQRWPQRPEAVTKKVICWPGQFQCDQQRQAWTIHGAVPPTLMHTTSQQTLARTSDIHYWVATDTGLRGPLGCVTSMQQRQTSLWPPALQTYIPSAWQTLTRLPKHDPRCQVTPATQLPLTIKGIEDGSRLRRHQSTQELPTITVRASGGEPDWYWLLNGELLAERGHQLTLTLEEKGRYELVVSDQTGRSDRLVFYID